MTLNFGSSSVDDLRGLGWSVSVHNDFSLKGVKYTFWLLSYAGEKGRFVSLKGEARTDVEALDEIRQQVHDMDFGRAGKLNYEPQIQYLQRQLHEQQGAMHRLQVELNRKT